MSLTEHFITFNRTFYHPFITLNRSLIFSYWLLQNLFFAFPAKFMKRNAVKVKPRTTFFLQSLLSKTKTKEINRNFVIEKAIPRYSFQVSKADCVWWYESKCEYNILQILAVQTSESKLTH